MWELKKQRNWNDRIEDGEYLLLSSIVQSGSQSDDSWDLKTVFVIFGVDVGWFSETGVFSFDVLSVAISLSDLGL